LLLTAEGAESAEKSYISAAWPLSLLFSASSAVSAVKESPLVAQASSLQPA